MLWVLNQTKWGNKPWFVDRIGNNAQSKVLPEYEKSTLSNLNYLCLSTHIVHIYLYLSWSFSLGTHMIANCLASVRPSRCKIWCLSRVQDEKSAASIWIYFTAIHHSKVYIYFTYNTYIYIYTWYILQKFFGTVSIPIPWRLYFIFGAWNENSRQGDV